MASKSSSRPRIVSHTSKGLFSCENTCPNWAGIRICSHSVAAACFCSELDEFLAKYRKKKGQPNLTRLSKVGLPKGAGKKGERPPRKRKCPETVHTFTPMNAPPSDSSLPSSPHIQSHVSPSVEATTNSVASSVVNYGWPMYYPPYYNSYSPSSHPPSLGQGIWPHSSGSGSSPPRPPQRQEESNPCILKFVSGNIRICQSCRGSLRSEAGTPLSPPLDLCVARLGKRQYWNSTANERCVPSKETNSHYCARVACVQFAYPTFVSSSLVVPDNVLVKLNSVHKNYLVTEFGLSL